MKSQDHKNYICLTELPNNTRGLVNKINGGRSVTARLNSMGILQGQSVKKICGFGPILVKVNDSYSIALGYGLASKIVIEY